ncbi:MAG: GAF domain-containing protein [bacterium]|nr:GAF domain-containing protein [bacterium]
MIDTNHWRELFADEQLTRQRAFAQYTDDIIATIAKLPGYSWCGFYWVVGDTLHLGAWRGPHATEHVAIPVGQGICGAAVTSRETVIVDDVTKDPRYLQCFLSTKSEIVVPIYTDGDPSKDVIGEIDIDSDKTGMFTSDDRLQLEKLATLIGKFYPTGFDPRLV